MNKTKAIFFDAAGTLFHVCGSMGKIYSDVARRACGILLFG
jgi:FMN phosphatase YigB (HAD superfamily)